MLRTSEDSPHAEVEPTRQGRLADRRDDDHAQRKANIPLHANSTTSESTTGNTSGSRKLKERKRKRRGTAALFDTLVQAMEPVPSCKRIKRACKPYDGRTVMYGYERGALRTRRKPRIGPTRVRAPTLLLLE